MKHSIAAKIFAASVGLFLFVLFIQWAFISGSFNRLYAESIYNSMQSELKKTIAGYRPKKAYDYYQPLSDYAQETGSPIFVFSENYEITDRDLLYKMRLITVSLPDVGDVHMPVGYLEDVYGPNAPFVARGRRVDVELAPVDTGGVYEPLSLRTADFSFKNRTGIEKYGALDGAVTGSGIITEARNLRQGDDLQTGRAEFIYNAVKDCLAYRLDIEDYLDTLCRETVTLSGFDYRFFYDTLTVDGVNYYFVTAQRVVVTGFERTYINRFFYVIYGILALVIVLAALMLSRWLSSPLKRLNHATRRLASLDFSEKVTYKAGDELGQLARNINSMSDSLQEALLDLRRSNDELEIASRRSRQNEERMKLLLADLAHEFKTPLGLVSGYLEVLQQGINPDKSDEYFQIIEDEVDQLTDVVNETVELTKLQSGYWRINRGNHSLRDIVGPVCHKFERRLADRGFTLKQDVIDVIVFCDAFRIAQVISNFLSNALKYSDERRRITVTAELSGQRVKVAVGNSGTLDDEEAKKIWTRYYSAGEASMARLPSQGIGLDIVRKILDAHESEYGVEQSGGMIYFTFTLPLVL